METPDPTPEELQLLAAITSEWQAQLSELDDSADDETLAAEMVGALLKQDYSPERLTALDPQLMDVFDAVTELETPLPSAADRARLWAQVREQVPPLAKTYGKSRD